MKHERWRAILAAQGDLDKLVAAAVGDFPAGGPPRAATVRPAPATAPRVAGGPQLVRPPTAAPRTVATQETTRLWREPARATTATATATAAAP
ncbi:MAG TPA: hypothetical protein VN253_08820, partial [Kofleriaceae bacterium]|nr:hypothetical protein [Kofleriaceae bacterium]